MASSKQDTGAKGQWRYSNDKVVRARAVELGEATSRARRATISVGLQVNVTCTTGPTSHALVPGVHVRKPPYPCRHVYSNPEMGDRVVMGKMMSLGIDGGRQIEDTKLHCTHRISWEKFERLHDLFSRMSQVRSSRRFVYVESKIRGRHFFCHFGVWIILVFGKFQSDLPAPLGDGYTEITKVVLYRYISLVNSMASIKFAVMIYYKIR